MKSTRSSQRRRTLCAVHRRTPRSLAFVALLGLAAAPAALQAADYTYNGTTGTFSTGFTPAISGATTADDLIFGGAAYTATDDVSGINANGVRFNNTGTVTIARGTGDNNITLGGTNPYIDFNNTGLDIVNTDRTFATSGFIVKSSSGAGTTNPIINGGIVLSTGATVQVVLADAAGDASAELSLTGVISGGGTLNLQNNAALPAALTGNAGIATPANQQDYGTLQISGNNTYTGGTNINAGRVVITNANAFGTGPVTVAGPNTIGTIASTGGTLAFGNGNYTNTAAGFPTGVITGGITIPNAVNIAGATTGNYGHALENNTGNNTISGLVTLTGTNVILTGNAATSLTMSGGVTETPGLGALLSKQGAFTLNVTNASYTGGTSIQGGIMQFNGTAPTAGQITVGTTAGQSTSALNFGTGTAFPTIASLLPLLSTASTGSIDLVANSNEAVNFDNLGGGTLSLGSAVPAPGVTYTGAISGTVVNLGGGTAAGVLTLPGTNQITGGSFLTVGPIGATSTVFLNAANNYSSGTAIAGGTLEIASAASIGSGALQFGAALNVTGGGGILQYAPGTTNNLTANDITAGGRTVTQAGFVGIDTNGNNVTYAGNFTSGTNLAPGSFTKYGLGTLTLNGAFGTSATVTGATNLFVRGGNLAVSGATASFTTNGYSSIGQFQGDSGTLSILNGAKVITAGDFNISDVNGTNGVVNISGAASSLAINTLYVGKGGNNLPSVALVTQGSVNQSGGTVTNNAGGGDWRIGGGGSTTDGSQNAVGSYDISGGSMTTTSNFQVGSYGTGQMTITGTGAVSATGFPVVGRFLGSYGVLNVESGTFTQPNTGNTIIVGETGTGILNVGYGPAGSTGTVVASNGAQLRIGNLTDAANPGKGTVNLGTGGVIQAKAVNTAGATATSVFDFHGGTLTATVASTTFMQGLTSAYIYGEGGTIDTGANAITIAQPLLAPSTGGVQTISVANGGTGYAASPVIKITSSTGAGIGASAIPVLTNGVLTAITITNPGNGYTAPVVTINGGNPATAATLGTVSLNPAASASGALTKIGTGTLTLTGTNTYAGGTLINAGVLVAGVNGALGTGNITIGTGSVAATLTINAGLTNAIADAASVSILGTGATASKLNLLSTSETVNQLSLGGTPQAIGTYGSSASAATFKNDTYFTGTGLLTVTAIVPEPGTWALLGLGVVALGVTEYRRRRQMALA